MLAILSHDETAAEQFFFIVKDDRLSRRYRALRFFKNGFNPVPIDPDDRFRRRRGIAHFCQNPLSVIGRRISIRENIVCGRNLTGKEILVVAEHDLILRAADLGYERRLAERDAKAFALSDRIVQDAAVPT